MLGKCHGACLFCWRNSYTREVLQPHLCTAVFIGIRAAPVTYNFLLLVNLTCEMVRYHHLTNFGSKGYYIFAAFFTLL